MTRPVVSALAVTTFRAGCVRRAKRISTTTPFVKVSWSHSYLFALCVSVSVCACMCNHHCDASVFVSVDSAGHGCGVAVVTEHGT